MKRFREFLCRWLGHTHRPVDAAIFIAEANAIDCQSGLPAFPNPELKCRRCGKVLWKRVDGEWIGMA